MGKKKKTSGVELMLLLNSTLRQLNNRLAREIDAEIGEITVEQLSLLIALWNKEGISQQDLGEFVDKDRPSITRLLDNMEKNNLVVRITNDMDRRVRLIYLTKKGKDFQSQLIKISESTIKKSLKNLDENNLINFVTVAEKIKSNILEDKQTENFNKSNQKNKKF